MIYKWKRWKYFGKCPLCNFREDTSFHIGKFCFPLCYRCTAIIIGALCGNYILQEHFISWKICLIGLILIIPCFVDGILQYHFYIQSTNKRRIITGMLAGLGLAFLHKYIADLP